ncbi:MAG TPA: radical SAM protein [Candidatus Thermoplasmatota archaeon]|nr:radical SAM protein [Candidatus Thermoplasmatota archaeon]
MRLSEIFYSLQGEGQEAGLPTVFVRFAGCSLRCAWCDTEYAFYGGLEAQVEEVVQRMEKYPTRRACVTGGEPLDQMEACLALMDALLKRGWTIQLETSGGVAIDRAVKLAPRRNLMVSLDVKCPSSGMTERNTWSNLALLEPHDQVKFIIGDEKDYEYARQVLKDHPEMGTKRVFLNPVWGISLKWLSERVLADGLDVHVGVQMHKLIWGTEKGR